MRRKRLAGVSAAVLAAVMLSGCSADEEVEATPDETTSDGAAPNGDGVGWSDGTVVSVWSVLRW